MRDEGSHEEPRWITEAMLLAIHGRQIERYGGAHGVVDEDAVGSTLARPRLRWTDDEDADLADLAAAHLVGSGRAQGFRDGNKRTGLACALVFLKLNGRTLHVPAQELYALCMQAATGRADDDVVAAWSRDRME